MCTDGKFSEVVHMMRYVIHASKLSDGMGTNSQIRDGNLVRRIGETE
jgi:hypothetical protein